jgi:hypothetical protein
MIIDGHQARIVVDGVPACRITTDGDPRTVALGMIFTDGAGIRWKWNGADFVMDFPAEEETQET